MLSLEIKNLDKLMQIGNKYPAIAELHVNKAIARSLVRVLGQEKQSAPFGVTGNLRDNWKIENGRFSGRLSSNAPYATAVEYGTAPHAVSAEEIGPWARKKGLNPWAVANSIKKKGTKANPFFKKAIQTSEEGVNKEFKDALDAIGKDLSKL